MRQRFINGAAPHSRRDKMTGHLMMIEALTSYLDAGVGNAAAIQSRIAFHKAQLAKRGVFVA